MGCTPNQGTRSEETSIINAEAALNFRTIKLNSFFRSLRRHSHNSCITPNDLLALSEEFNFKIHNFGVHQHIEKLFDSFKDDQGNYKQTQLGLLAVLLSEDKPEAKCKLIFDYFATEKQKDLLSSVVKEILTEMFRISGYNLILLINSKHVDQELEEMIEKYCKKIMKVIELAVNRICRKHFAEEFVEFGTFLGFFEQNPILITATGLRYHLYDLKKREKSRILQRSVQVKQDDN